MLKTDLNEEINEEPFEGSETIRGTPQSHYKVSGPIEVDPKTLNKEHHNASDGLPADLNVSISTKNYSETEAKLLIRNLQLSYQSPMPNQRMNDHYYKPQNSGSEFTHFLVQALNEDVAGPQDPPPSTTSLTKLSFYNKKLNVSDQEKHIKILMDNSF